MKKDKNKKEQKNLEKKVKKKVSKRLKTILFIFIILLLVGIGAIGYDMYKNRYYKELNYTEFFNKWHDKKSFILVIKQNGCSHCDSYMPKMQEISNEYKINIFYINSSKFTADESSAFSNLINYSGTPTTAFIVNGEEPTTSNRINGNLSKDNIINKLKSLDYIK